MQCSFELPVYIIGINLSRLLVRQRAVNYAIYKQHKRTIRRETARRVVISAVVSYIHAIMTVDDDSL